MARHGMITEAGEDRSPRRVPVTPAMFHEAVRADTGNRSTRQWSLKRGEREAEVWKALLLEFQGRTHYGATYADLVRYALARLAREWRGEDG